MDTGSKLWLSYTMFAEMFEENAINKVWCFFVSFFSHRNIQALGEWAKISSTEAGRNKSIQTISLV